jgi:cytochrome c oxidase assembly factor CtaG
VPSFDPTLAAAPQFTWTMEPGVVAAAIVATALFVRAFVRLRARGRTDHASWDRPLLFAAGLAALVLPLVSPLDPIADDYLLSAHMLEHVLIGDAAPALLLLALRGPLLFFFVPAQVLVPLARAQPLRRALAFVLRPKISLAVWASVIAVWHLPAAYDYTLSHQTVHDFEHACFFVAGLLVWAQLIDPARRHRLSRGARLGYAATLFWLGTILADVLIFSFHPLYPAYAAQPDRLLALSPVRDQQLAGLVMMAEQLLTLGTFGLILVLPIVRGPQRPDRPGIRPRTQVSTFGSVR